MENVIVNTGGKCELIALDKFIKDYNLAPKCTGDRFYIIHQEGRDWFTHSFPNPACVFSGSQFLYIVYKGNMEYIVNGVRMPNVDFIEERYAFASEEEAKNEIHRIEDSHKGEMYIDCPDGTRIKIDN